MKKTLRSLFFRFLGVLLTTGLPGSTFYRQTEHKGLLLISWLVLAMLVAMAATAHHERKECTR